MIKDFVSIDLETTGLLPKEDHIIELAAVRFRDGEEAAVYHSYLNPGREIPQRITELTGITPDMVRDAPQFADVCSAVLDFVGDDVLMAHHISFDFAFLKRAVLNCMNTKEAKTKGFEKKGIDTLKIARYFLPEMEAGEYEAHMDVQSKYLELLTDGNAAFTSNIP